MKITLRGNAELTRRQANMIKWKLGRLQQKFNHLLYADVFVKDEGRMPGEYKMSMRLGIAGPDIFISNRSDNLYALVNQMCQNAHRYLAKRREMW